MTDPDSIRQLTDADTNVNGCPHEKPRLGTGRLRKNCLLCQPYGEQPRVIAACSHCGKVIMFDRSEHRGNRGYYYCSDACFAFAPSQNHRVKDLGRLGTLHPTPRHCKNCGAYFSPARSRRSDIVFCSKGCNDEHRSKNDRRYAVGRAGECGVCGEVKPLKHGVRGKKTTCADCHIRQVEGERRECEERKARERFVAVVGFVARREGKRRNREAERAERRRAKEMSHQEALLTRKCRVCGVLLLPFVASVEDRAKTACPDCAEEVRRRTKATHRTARKAKQRAVSIESVDPFLVFERDGWTCHICGRPAPKEKRGSYEDDAPELDHVVTLSEGGEHSYRNTACACRSCNLQKGGKSFGQLHLGLI